MAEKKRTIKRIMKELTDLQKDNNAVLRGIEVDEENIFIWTGYIYPENPPYNKAAFKIRIAFPEEYPWKPYILKFLTEIYNPLVSPQGYFCRCFRGGYEGWSPASTVERMLKKLLVTLYDPDYMHAIRGDIRSMTRKQYLEKAEECAVLYGEVKLNAAIFYSQTDRAGTKEKADVMQSILSTVAVKATNAEWTNAPDLQDHLHKAVQQLSQDCNLLLVCIMSHDRMGGVMLPIDELIKQITQDTPRNTRLIILVQACQIVSFANATGENIDPLSQPVDVNLASPPNGCMHIELKRPNTVLLMASLTEGSAVWGEYTEALAAEISKADGEKHIYDMHTHAVEAMRNEMAMYLVDEIGQIPQYRDQRRIEYPRTP